MKSILGLVLILFLTQGVGYADPSIGGMSGTLSNGSSFSISGSGFGTKSPAAPILWETFEDGSNGAGLAASSDNWSLYSGTGSVNGGTYTTTSPYAGSLCVYNTISPGANGFNTSYHTFTASNEVYYSYMSRYTYTGSIGTFVLKNGRSGTNLGIYNGTGEIAISDGYVFWIDDNGYYYPTGRYASGLGSSSWTRHEIYKKNSVPAGTANGVCQFFVHNGATGCQEKNYANIVNRQTGSWQQTSVLLGLMGANPVSGSTHTIYIDNVYVDNTRARVELGNASTWGSCTKREVQIPSAWADTAITLTANIGSIFTSGQTAYLFVVDSTGAASPGYQVTIGGTPPDPTCSDGVQNGDETGVDCGGSCPTCPRCPSTCSGSYVGYSVSGGNVK